MTTLQAAAPPQPGVSEPLARARSAAISSLSYELSFHIPERKADALTGSAVLRFVLKKPGEVILDFDQPAGHVARMIVNEVPGVAVTFVNGHMVIPAGATKAGENIVSIDFTPGEEALNRTDEFLYTLHVPARARLTFPCFDQPDLKARYRLRVGVPEGWSVVANGEAKRVADGVTEFAETPPLSTYLFAFAAGKFKMETAERNGRTFRMFHRETDAAKVARNRDALFDLHAKALAWLEDYTGIPYPWGKFDFVLIPSFQFGGMEHPGQILYNASSMMLDESATQNQLLGRASTISHETAHMWFGDLVTMRWFNDVWMKEVMANFMAAKIVNPSFPQVNHDLRFLLAYYPAAYEIDRTAGANPIRQELGNLEEAGSLYGNIIYDKAPVVMRQLETILGEQGFRDGLRDYLKKYSFANATWLDLVKILDDRTPEDLAAWSKSWVEQRGRPQMTTEVSIGSKGIERLVLKQQDPLKRGVVWPQRLQIALGYADHVEKLAVDMKAATTSVTAAVGKAAPLYILPTGGGLGYGGFALDAASRRYLLDHLEDLKDPVDRASAIVVLWEELLDHRLEPADFLRLLQRVLPKEPDEQNAQLLLGHLSSAYWEFLNQPQRLAAAGQLEGMLREGLKRASTTSQKSAWFSTFRSIVQTQSGVEWLARLWRREEKIDGLPLAEQDEIALAAALALREAPGSAEILQRQLERTKDADRRARLAFVMPALSADASVRAQAFDRFRDVSNRRREPWVLESLTYLHHPLRQESSKPFVKPSLEMLQEIQQTGDIFFPKRWMDATLGPQRSPEVAAVVRQFLDRSPGLPERLRWVVLSSADGLFRAVP
jgi:aminopeptidase N